MPKQALQVHCLQYCRDILQVLQSDGFCMATTSDATGTVTIKQREWADSPNVQ